MRHQKIIKREDGTRINIVIDLLVNLQSRNFGFKLFVCAPKKRTFYNVQNDDLGLNKLTTSEILAAKLELWEMIKPL